MSGPSDAVQQPARSGAARRPACMIPLTHGQAVTVVVAVGLEVLARRRAQLPTGFVHPSDLTVDATGRPRVVAPRGQEVDAPDEHAVVVRLALALAEPGSPLWRCAHRSLHRRGARLEELLGELAGLDPEPVPPSVRPRLSGPARARHAARRRWWGRRT